ncbi:hypothetical protein Bca4012_020497 [Brassica carinata]
MDRMLLKVLTKGQRKNQGALRGASPLRQEQRQSESVWNEAFNKENSIAAQIDLIDAYHGKGNFDSVAELEKLTAEHIEAEGNLADVKVKVPDWFKLGEKWMMDD